MQGQAPELILADYHLDHGVVGCEVVRHLREHFSQTIPAVIITADRTEFMALSAIGNNTFCYGEDLPDEPWLQRPRAAQTASGAKP